MCAEPSNGLKRWRMDLKGKQEKKLRKLHVCLKAQALLGCRVRVKCEQSANGEKVRVCFKAGASRLQSWELYLSLIASLIAMLAP
eukprot:scaffold116925_cov20-Tisochrysis_lutea.AAC.2